MFSKKFLALALLFSVLCANASAQDLNLTSPLSGLPAGINIELEKNSIKAGETLNAKISVLNASEYAIVNGIITINVSKLAFEESIPVEAFSPSSDMENVYFEEYAEGINLLQSQSKTVDFSYALPKELENGKYKIEAYLNSKRTNLSGNAFAMANPSSKEFKVDGTNQPYPEMKILKGATYFGKKYSDLLSLEANKDANVFVSIQNLAKKTQNAKISIKICEIEDIKCENAKSEKETSETLKPEQKNDLNYAIKAPQKPGQYFAKIILQNSIGKIFSIAKKTINVSGNNAKIESILFEKIPTQGNELKFAVKTNAAGTITVKITDSKANPLFNSSQSVLASETEKPFDAAIPFAARQFNVCTSLNSIDELCYFMDLEKFPAEKPQSSLSMEWNYDNETKSVFVKFTNTAGEKRINVLLNVFDLEKNSKIYGETIDSIESYSKAVPLAGGKYLLNAVDLIGGKSFNENINTETAGKFIELKNCSELGGKTCETGLKCSFAVKSKDLESCCIGSCGNETITPTQSNANKNPIKEGNIIMLAGIVAAIAAVFLFMKFANKPKKRETEESAENPEETEPNNLSDTEISEADLNFEEGEKT